MSQADLICVHEKKCISTTSATPKCLAYNAPGAHCYDAQLQQVRCVRNGLTRNQSFGKGHFKHR